MSDPARTPRPRRGQGFWLTAGEIVGVLALIIAGLNFWDSHQQHAEERRREQTQSRAETAFVAVGEADREGRTITLHALKSTQAIESQRYRFAHDVLDHLTDRTAARPTIEADWIAEGLKRALERSHAPAAGEALTPVAVETSYVEGGDTHTDVSLYQVGFAWKRGLFGGWQIRLRGLSLARRALTGDPAPLVEARWTADQQALPHR
jgi:hypothetical protein